MTDLNIQSFKSVSESAKARMQKERDNEDLPKCIGFHHEVLSYHESNSGLIGIGNQIKNTGAVDMDWSQVGWGKLND
jgi:hypothetical protein